LIDALLAGIILPEVKSVKTACEACGLILETDSDSEGYTLVCPRCANVIKGRSGMLYSLVFSLSAVVLMPPAMLYPFLKIRINDYVLTATLFESVAALNSEGYLPAGIAVFLTAFLIPLLYLFLVAYVSYEAVSGRKLPFSGSLAHFIHSLHRWHMVDVFLVGILVSVVKLVDTADVYFGVGFYLLSAVCFFLIVSEMYFDSKVFWRCHDRY
jgi:paraquat-inducible protein A